MPDFADTYWEVQRDKRYSDIQRAAVHADLRTLWVLMASPIPSPPSNLLPRPYEIIDHHVVRQERPWIVGHLWLRGHA